MIVKLYFSTCVWKNQQKPCNCQATNLAIHWDISRNMSHLSGCRPQLKKLRDHASVGLDRLSRQSWCFPFRLLRQECYSRRLQECPEKPGRGQQVGEKKRRIKQRKAKKARMCIVHMYILYIYIIYIWLPPYIYVHKYIDIHTHT